MVVFLLGFVAIDAAIRFAAIREAADAAAGAANDAAVAFEPGDFYDLGETGSYGRDRLDGMLAAALRGREFRHFELTSTATRVERDGDAVIVRVDLGGRVALPFARVVPGLDDHVDVEVWGKATLVEERP
jgi:hypothetical protein